MNKYHFEGNQKVYEKIESFNMRVPKKPTLIITIWRRQNKWNSVFNDQFLIKKTFLNLLLNFLINTKIYRKVKSKVSLKVCCLILCQYEKTFAGVSFYKNFQNRPRNRIVLLYTSNKSQVNFSSTEISKLKKSTTLW